MLPEFTISNVQPGISVETRSEALEEKATVIHCTLRKALWIRMWPSTYLIQQDDVKKKLLHIFNIDYFPGGRVAPAGYQFTLIFEGLDQDCTSFDLFEKAEEKGGFIVPGIQRNNTDVYHVFIDTENLQP